MKNHDLETSVFWRKDNPLLKLTLWKKHFKEEILAHKYEIYQTNTTHTLEHPVKIVISIRSNLPDQISFLLHL